MSTAKSRPTGISLTNVTTYQAGVAQATAHRLLQKYCDKVLRPYGISKMQWLIVGTVLDAGSKGIRISSLADRLGTTMPYMTTSIKMLELKGVLVRSHNAQDSRSKLVTVSQDFEPKCGEIEQVLRDALRASIYGNINPEEFRVYMKVLFELCRVQVKAKS